MATLQDRRRILGPADTQPLLFDTNESVNTASISEVSRNRKESEIRPICM